MNHIRKSTIITTFCILCLLLMLSTASIASAHLQNDEYTQILLHFDNGEGSTSITDETGRQWASVNNAAQDDSNIFDSSPSSLSLSSAGYQYIRTTNTSGLSPGKQDFTIEFFAKRNSIGAYQRIFGNMRTDLSMNNASIDVQFLNTDKMRLALGDGTTYKALISNTAVTDTEWHKYVLQRKGRYLVMWKDDEFWGLKDIGADFSALDSNTQYSIGCSGDIEYLFFNGSIDEFRYSVGTARVTSNWMDWYAYGDSNTDAVAVGLNPNDGSLCYIFTTANILNMTADHAIGGYGQKSDWGLANIEKYYPYSTNYIIMFGSNDMHTGVPATTAAKNVKDIYNYTSSRGSNTIICVPLMAVEGANYYSLTYQQQWLSDFENNITGYPYILAYDSSDTTTNNRFPDAINSSMFVADGIHINEAGHIALGTQIANYYLSTQAVSQPPQDSGIGDNSKFGNIGLSWNPIVLLLILVPITLFAVAIFAFFSDNSKVGVELLISGCIILVLIPLFTKIIYKLSV